MPQNQINVNFSSNYGIDVFVFDLLGVLGTKAHFFTLGNLLFVIFLVNSQISAKFSLIFFVFDTLLHTIHAYNAVCMQHSLNICRI